MSQPPPNSRAIVFTEIEQFGGAERAALALARWLTERSLPVHIVCYSDQSGLASYADFPLEVVQLLPRTAAVAKIGALRKYFTGAAWTMKPLLSGYQPAMHGTLAGLRGFHDLMHDTPSLFDPDAAGLKDRVRRVVSNEVVGNGLRSGGKTIVTSEFLREECRRDFRVEAEIARMGGLSHGGMKLRPFAATRELRMLSVCRLEANKRLDWLLRALATLDKAATAPLTAALSQLADWRFDIAGKGPQLEALKLLAQELGIEHRVRFHGFVPDAELEAMYAEAHLFLMPAVQGYGIPAIEALGRGIPVLLHRESGVSDILLETPWATVFAGDERNTQPALAKAIEGVLQGRHLDVALPELPTEDSWAERVATLCGWS